MKTSKQKHYRIQILNIKLLSNNRKGDSAYKDIIDSIFKNKINVPVRGGKNAILRTRFFDSYEKENDIIYGSFCKFTTIDTNDWLNYKNLEVENVSLPEDMFPNLVETDYIFIPQAHRFIIVLTPSVNIRAAEQFFNLAIKKVISPDESYEVNIEQSEDAFEQIINAEFVRKLYVSISYSNADTGDDAYEFMDKEIRDSSIGRLNMDISPDHNNNIQTDTTLISGALKVAKSNGFAKATIIENGRRIKVETQNHPETLSIVAEPALLKKSIFDKIIDIYRKHAKN